MTTIMVQLQNPSYFCSRNRAKPKVFLTILRKIQARIGSARQSFHVNESSFTCSWIFLGSFRVQTQQSAIQKCFNSAPMARLPWNSRPLQLSISWNSGKPRFYEEVLELNLIHKFHNMVKMVYNVLNVMYDFPNTFYAKLLDPFNSYITDAIKVMMEGTPWPLCRFSGWSKRMKPAPHDMSRAKKKIWDFKSHQISPVSCTSFVWKLHWSSSWELPQISQRFPSNKAVWNQLDEVLHVDVGLPTITQA